MMICQIILMGLSMITDTGGPPQSLAHRAEAAFGQLDYSQAAALYQNALSQQPEVAWLEFNLGTSALADKQFGQGVLHLRRALVLAPRSEGIRHNLSVAREQRQDVIDERETAFLTRSVAASVGRLTATERRLVWGLLLALGVSTTLALSRKRSVGLWVAGCLVLPINLAWPMAVFLQERELERSAVVVADELVVRASTHPDSLVRFRLHAGAEVEIYDDLKDWVRVRLDTRRDGWTHHKGLCRVHKKSR